MPREKTTASPEAMAELAAQVAKLWVDEGRDAVTYTSVGKLVGKSRSMIQYLYPSAEDLVRAAALHLAGERTAVMWGAIELNPDAVETDELAKAEALVWLCRYGGHPYDGTNGLAELEAQL